MTKNKPAPVPAPEPDVSVNPDDVMAFLASSKVEKTVEVELTPEEQTAVVETLNKEFEEERITVPVPPVFNEKNMPGSKTGIWTMDAGDLMKVEVTESEKESYWRSLLHDTQVELTITIPIKTGLKVKVRTIDSFEQELVFAAIRKDDKEGQLPTLEFSVSRLQRYFATMQLLLVNDEPLALYSGPSKDEERVYGNFDVEIEKLRKARVRVDKWSQPKWLALFLALRIFETKLTILHNGALNQDFWNPASAG